MKLIGIVVCVISAGCLLAQGIQSGGTEAAPEGAIEGAVVNEVTHEAVRKAQVTLVPGNSLPAVTDVNGHFAFRNLGPGTYQLHAQHPEYPLAGSGLAVMRPLMVTLLENERKRDVVIPLTPGASISGSVFGEDDKPVAGCDVQVLQFLPGQAGERLYGTRAGASDDRGQYRIYGLAKGHYYVSARCGEPLPVAHGFARRGADGGTSKRRYATEFYPDSPDPSGAARVMVAAGANLEGIDFHLHTTSTFAVQGRVTGDPEALSRHPRLDLVPRDPMLGSLVQYSASIDPQTGAFRIADVPSGAYTLTGTAQDAGRAWQGKAPVDIGDETPEAIDLPLIPGAELSGTIEIEGDRPNTSLENLHIRMTPLDAEFMGPWPGSKVEKDGTFALSGVLPGRWCLSVENIQGHIKSLTFGGQEAHSCAFAVAAGGALQVVVSTKMAEVEGTLQGTRLGDGGLVVILAPEDEDRVPGAVRTFPAGSDGRFRAPGIAPGRYRLYGAGNVEAAALQQNPRVLKALAGRGTRVELEAGGKSTAQAQILSTEEVNQAFLEVE